ncbi:outer membrane protein TolC [Lacibacter cauensis]|uniref:Outer membrane protein TolC n=1 Tax=Lacibacter cauensis TaxID=510947 RepID=A0A562SS52_9BACT|nr:TolC family protein [Lacibacter cauensis]TWI83844.1 outer membrane protein TolC [Lacibacter cauensis]
MKKKLKLLLASWLISSIALAQDASKLTIDEAIRIAVEKNFDVEIERNAQQIGAINNNWGTAGLLPTISATSTVGIASNNLEQRLTNGTTIKRNGAILRNQNAGLAVSWRVFDGMRMFATKRRLEELEKIGELSFRSQVNTTVFNVIAAYYQIVQLNQQKKALQATIKFFEERKQIAESRFTIGTAPKTDFLQAEVDLNQQKGNLLTVENSIRIAKADFNNLLARKPETVFEVLDVIEPDAALTFAALVTKSQSDNYDLLLAQSNLSVLVQQKREIISQRLPSVTLNGNFNLAQSRNDAGFTLFNRNLGPSGNIGIAIPIFQGGNIKRQEQVADINIKNQQVIIDRLKNQVYTNLLNAYSNFQNALNLVKLEKNTLALIEENNLISTERFRKLAITSLELRQVQIDYINGQTRYINSLYMAKLAEAEMKLLAGDLSKL